jgi:hypothetical protein
MVIEVIGPSTNNDKTPDVRFVTNEPNSGTLRTSLQLAYFYDTHLSTGGLPVCQTGFFGILGKFGNAVETLYGGIRLIPKVPPGLPAIALAAANCSA